MAATIMDGKALAAKVKEEVRQQTAQMGRKPGLAVVLVGDDPASRVYVNGKKRDCGECGIYSEEYALPAETSQQELLELVEALNGREDIDGICPCPDTWTRRPFCWPSGRTRMWTASTPSTWGS